MDWVLYLPARGLILLLQALPLTWVARIGRAGGALAYNGVMRGTGGWRSEI